MALKQSSNWLIAAVYYFVGIFVFNIVGLFLLMIINAALTITNPTILWAEQLVWLFISVCFAPWIGARYIKSRYLVKNPDKIALFAAGIYALINIIAQNILLANQGAKPEALSISAITGIIALLVYYLSSKYFVKSNVANSQPAS